MRHRDADETQARLRKTQSMRHGDADKTQARLRLERQRVGALVRRGDADKTRARFRLERHRERATRTDGWLGAGVGCED